MKTQTKTRLKMMGLLLAGLVGTNPAHAGLTLTAAGIAEGFTLSTFASGFTSNSSGVGPISTAYPVSGGVLATSYATGEVIRFATDSDNQVIGGVGVTVASSGYSAPTGMASAGGKVYMVEQGNGKLDQLNDDGTLNHTVPTTLSLADSTGLAADPLTGLLYVSSPGNSQIMKVDPTTGATSLFLNKDMDGIATDGTILYGAEGGSINGYKLSDGSLVFSSGLISTSDGAALGQGSLLGKLYVNTNDGNLYEATISGGAKVLIATGGSRGDLVSVDPNGSLLLSQSNSLVRLTAPAGGSFNTTPEPATWAAALMGAGVLAYFGRRTRQITA